MQEIADEICDRLSLGESLRSICGDVHMPERISVYRWLRSDKHEEFRYQYAIARESQGDTMFDDILEIADDGLNDWMEKRDEENANLGWRENGEALNRSRIRIDARKWMAGKLRPKKYGDAAMVKLADADGGKIEATDIETRVLAMVLAAAARDAGDD